MKSSIMINVDNLIRQRIQEIRAEVHLVFKRGCYKEELNSYNIE